MTGYTVNTGSTTKFSQGWDRIFAVAKAPKAAKKPATEGSPAKAAAKAPVKPAAKTPAAAKGEAKTVRSKKAAQAALTSGKR